MVYFGYISIIGSCDARVNPLVLGSSFSGTMVADLAMVSSTHPLEINLVLCLSARRWRRMIFGDSDTF